MRRHTAVSGPFTVGRKITLHPPPLAAEFRHIPPAGFGGGTQSRFSRGGSCIVRPASPSSRRMKTFAYIDGFNLYFAAVKDAPLRWLDPHALLASTFPRNQIAGIRYFTAAVSDRGGNPGQSQRQQIYWRALRTLPHLEIIEGDFRTREVSAKVVQPPPPFIRVFKTEEKGSDVNLAAHLLMDGFRGLYDAAIVVSGDSDLVTPVRMVRDELRKPVGVLNPQRLSGPGHPQPRHSAGLRQAASFYQNGLTWGQLTAAQFPAALTDTHGTITRPAGW